MTAPNPTDLSVLKNGGAKLIVYHGTSDPIFSSDDSVACVEGLRSANGGDASNFARLFLIPGMNHCSGGPATDQFDMLTPLVNWVERARPPTASSPARAARAARAARTRRPRELAAEPDAAALQLSRGRALQRQRQPGAGEELHLPVIAARGTGTLVTTARRAPRHEETAG